MKLVSNFKEKYLQAGIQFPYRRYLLLLFLIPLLFLSCGLGVVFAFVELFNLPYQIMFFPILAGLSSFILLLIYPYDKVRVRRKNIDMNLPHALNYMASISETGVSPISMFKAIAKFDAYEEVSKEAATIVKNAEFLGKDLLTVLERHSNRTPSEAFKQTLKGLISVLSAGGDTGSYFRQKYNEMMFKRIRREAEYEKSLSIYENIFTVLLVIAPLLFFIFVMIGEMMSPGTTNAPMLLRLFIYIFLPIGNIGFIMMLKLTRG